MAQLAIAEKLGMTLGQLRHTMNEEELILWLSWFQLKNEDEQAAINKARKKR